MSMSNLSNNPAYVLAYRHVCIYVLAAQHRAAVRKVSQAKPIHGGLGMELEKAKIMQNKIEDFVKHMSDLLHIERDAELEFTQEELNAVSSPDEESDGLKPIEYLVSHGQAQQEQCDTICNLNAISSFTGELNLLVKFGDYKGALNLLK